MSPDTNGLPWRIDREVLTLLALEASITEGRWDEAYPRNPHRNPATVLEDALEELDRAISALEKARDRLALADIRWPHPEHRGP